MMKFFVAVAMFTLIGYSLSSAAAIESGENDTPKSMNDFKENLENLLHVVSEAIQENAKSDENIDLKDLIPEIHDEDDKLEVPNEESFIETEEEEDPLSDEISTGEDDEISTGEDDEISTGEDDENDNGRIRCYWRGRYGRCCKSFRIRRTRIRLRVCLSAKIYPPSYMKIILRLNGHRLWRHTVRSHHRYRICFRKGHFQMCFYIYRLYISSHRAHACLYFRARYHFFHYRTRIGCFYKRYSENEISTNKETPLHFIENQKHTDDLFPIPKEMNQSNDVFGFDQ